MFSSAHAVNTCAVFLISLHIYQTTVMNKDNTMVTANVAFRGVESLSVSLLRTGESTYKN